MINLVHTRTLSRNTRIKKNTLLSLLLKRVKEKLNSYLSRTKKPEIQKRSNVYDNLSYNSDQFPNYLSSIVKVIPRIKVIEYRVKERDFPITVVFHNGKTKKLENMERLRFYGGWLLAHPKVNKLPFNSKP